ncbi:prepilin-type N-terminal cleavage/methylation domain-containing protein [Stenotrophomonas sp. PvP093]|uniref:type II secretion system protein n=1 Tax=unclassified Stenotrophomonas TaxID=196198 RepID=UPI001AEB11F3|nr:type II secretion system protein [Stenotrophomonas sp. PvP093]MBP2480151.1 prepilin-type N-terminal cleavage/methylation domain-containing protein [Stenotrophomonas sp. PvP093]
MRSAVRGFTLFELLIAVVIVGILILLLSPLFAQYVTSTRAAYREQAQQDNQAIADAMVQWAKANGGHLPAPYTGAGYTMTVHNPLGTSAAEVSFRAALSDLSLSRTSINDDGTAARNVRVYQRVGGLTKDMPLYVRSGPAVRLTYDLGVLYMTECPLSGGSCNPSPSTGRPGASPALTTANRNTWTAVAPDIGAKFVSTLPHEVEMLSATARRADRVRDALLAYYRGKQISAAATDTTNWYPGSALAGKSPAGNQGCRDGWYALDSTQILPLVGLSQQEFGVTAWGGRFEYCADFDPLGNKSPNAPPHAAAVRFNADVSSASPPDPMVISNNVVLTL